MRCTADGLSVCLSVVTFRYCVKAVKHIFETVSWSPPRSRSPIIIMYPPGGCTSVLARPSVCQSVPCRGCCQVEPPSELLFYVTIGLGHVTVALASEAPELDSTLINKLTDDKRSVVFRRRSPFRSVPCLRFSRNQ